MEFNFLGRNFEFFTSQRQVIKFETYVNTYILNIWSMVAIILTIILLNVNRYLKRGLSEEKYEKLEVAFPFYYIYLIITFFLLNRPNFGEHSSNFWFDNWFWGTNSIHETMVITFFINLLFFIPLGYLVYKYWKHSITNYLFIVVLLLMIEEAQYILCRGTASLTDFVAYLLGTIIGSLVCSFKKEKPDDYE